MKVTKEQAIEVFKAALDTVDDWASWMELDFGLYDEENDEVPSEADLFEALGVSREDVE